MARCMLLAAALLATMVTFNEAILQYRPRYHLGTYVDDDEEYIKHFDEIMNAYRGEVGRYVVETDARVDTKYRAWKRNADFINSILALPKGMNDAGR